MGYANNMHCLNCDRSTIYVGEEDEEPGVVMFCSMACVYAYVEKHPRSVPSSVSSAIEEEANAARRRHEGRTT